MNDLEWRLRVVGRSVAQGKSDPRDLEAVKAHGVVTKPLDGLCMTLAREAAKNIDAAKPRVLKHKAEEL